MGGEGREKRGKGAELTEGGGGGATGRETERAGKGRAKRRVEKGRETA